MTGPEMRAAIADLGLTQVAFAALLDVTDRSVRKWTSGDSIPGPVALLTDILLASQEARALAGLPGHGSEGLDILSYTGHTTPTATEDTAMPPLIHIPTVDDPDDDGYPPPCSDPNGHSWVISDEDDRSYCELCGADGDA